MLFGFEVPSASVILGHGDCGAVTGYVAKAKAGGHAYFAMSNRQWVRLGARFGAMLVCGK